MLASLRGKIRAIRFVANTTKTFRFWERSAADSKRSAELRHPVRKISHSNVDVAFLIPCGLHSGLAKSTCCA